MTTEQTNLKGFIDIPKIVVESNEEIDLTPSSDFIKNNKTEFTETNHKDFYYYNPIDPVKLDVKYTVCSKTKQTYLEIVNIIGLEHFIYNNYNDKFNVNYNWWDYTDILSNIKYVIFDFGKTNSINANKVFECDNFDVYEFVLPELESDETVYKRRASHFINNDTTYVLGVALLLQDYDYFISSNPEEFLITTYKHKIQFSKNSSFVTKTDINDFDADDFTLKDDYYKLVIKHPVIPGDEFKVSMPVYNQIESSIAGMYSGDTDDVLEVNAKIEVQNNKAIRDIMEYMILKTDAYITSSDTEDYKYKDKFAVGVYDITDPPGSHGIMQYYFKEDSNNLRSDFHNLIKKNLKYNPMLINYGIRDVNQDESVTDLVYGEYVQICSPNTVYINMSNDYIFRTYTNKAMDSLPWRWQPYYRNTVINVSLKNEFTSNGLYTLLTKEIDADIKKSFTIKLDGDLLSIDYNQFNRNVDLSYLLCLLDYSENRLSPSDKTVELLTQHSYFNPGILLANSLCNIGDDIHKSGFCNYVFTIKIKKPNITSVTEQQTRDLINSFCNKIEIEKYEIS